MLRIRLQRIGRKDQPYFRVVVAESTVKQEGKVVEIIGQYDPQKDGKERLSVDKDRIKYWQSKGAKMSEGAMKLLLTTAEKKKIWPDKKKAKTEEEKSTEAGPKADSKTEEVAEASADETPNEAPEAQEGVTDAKE